LAADEKTKSKHWPNSIFSEFLPESGDIFPDGFSTNYKLSNVSLNNNFENYEKAWLELHCRVRACILYDRASWKLVQRLP
jgi:hypothetical protein